MTRLIVREAIENVLDVESSVPRMIARACLKRLHGRGLKTTKADLSRFTAAFERQLGTPGTRMQLPISEERLARAGLSVNDVEGILNVNQWGRRELNRRQFPGLDSTTQEKGQNPPGS